MEWKQVEIKQKNKKIIKNNLTRDQIIDKLKMLEKYTPRLVVLYGSYSRNQNNSSSDIDILIIWNKMPYNTKTIKDELVSLFNKNVDLVSMLFVKTNKNIQDTQEIDFLDNILVDGIVIIGTNINDLKFSKIIVKD
jgi:predicted nucleotidyltransferase